MLRHALAAFAMATLSACATSPPAPTDPLAAVTLPALPDWTDRYASSVAGDVRFFEIEALMRRHQLTRLQAVELQNHYRDLGRAAAPGDPTARFDEALRRVRAGAFESRLDPARLAAAELIVAFDLDETLYDQSLAPDTACVDLEAPQPDGSTRRIALAPAWRDALTRLHALGAVIVLFTANLDDLTHANLRAWHLDGTPLPDHPAIAGVLTNSHLVRQSKHEGPGHANPRRGHPVTEPSKDLRLLDESLTRVVIVDDNPQRLFQPRNALVPVPWDADRWCAAPAGPARDAAHRALVLATDHIEDALTWARAHGQPFVTGLLPFTDPGRRMVDLLVTSGLPRDAAVAWVRAHPHLAPER